MKKGFSLISILFAILLLFSNQNLVRGQTARKEGNVSNPGIVALVIAPEDFRDEELFVPLEGLKKAGFKTIVASTKKGKATGMLGGTAETETTIGELKAEDILALIVVGGGGSPKHLWGNEKLQTLSAKLAKEGKVVASICLSPVVLARAGILKGKKATVWKDDEAIAELKKGGAVYEDKPCIQDGKVVTANGPKAAKDFLESILKLLPKNPQTK